MCSQLESAITLAIYLGVGLVAVLLIIGPLFVWRVWWPAFKEIRQQHVESFSEARDRINGDTEDWINDRRDSVRRGARRARRTFTP